MPEETTNTPVDETPVAAAPAENQVQEAVPATEEPVTPEVPAEPVA